MMYFGDIVRGAPEGIGVLYQNGKLIYKGQVKNGRRHGNGVLYKNEQKLVVDSEWQEDKLQKLTLEDGK
jgi:antitoxin component YwqK of YwqJK toxin-antitoxin module